MGSHTSILRRAAAVAAVVGFVSAVALAQSTSSPRSVREGVYTAAQADRGQALYEEKCTGCHASRMWGSDWTEKSLWDVYDTISNFMPQDSPGSLAPRESRDVVAYILRINRLPPGTHELPEADDALKGIRIELPAQ